MTIDPEPPVEPADGEARPAPQRPVGVRREGAGVGLGRWPSRRASASRGRPAAPASAYETRARGPGGGDRLGRPDEQARADDPGDGDHRDVARLEGRLRALPAERSRGPRMWSQGRNCLLQPGELIPPHAARLRAFRTQTLDLRRTESAMRRSSRLWPLTASHTQTPARGSSTSRAMATAASNSPPASARSARRTTRRPPAAWQGSAATASHRLRRTAADRRGGEYPEQPEVETAPGEVVVGRPLRGRER